MTKWMLGAIIVLGTILSLGSGLWATPVEITTQGQLLFALDQACAKAGQLQTASQVLCNQVKERLKEELQKRLQQHRSIKLDSDLLGEVLAWTAQWNQSGIGANEALQLALGLTEMLDQGAYGEKLHELLAYGQAAGYTPEELTDLVTQLAEMVTAWTPAENILDEALKHLDKAMPGERPEEVLEAIQHGMNDDTPQGPSNFDNEEGMPPMEQSNGQIEKGPALDQLPSDKGEAAEAYAPNLTDKKQQEDKPEWGHQPPSDKGGEMEVIVPPTTDKKQPADKGPEWGNQPPDDEGEEIEASPPVTTDEEEDEGASHGSGHKHGGSGKKGKSGEGK